MHTTDLAAATAALCLLARQLRRAPHIERLQISLLAARADMGPKDALAERNAQLVGFVLRAFKEALQVNCALRCETPLLTYLQNIQFMLAVQGAVPTGVGKHEIG